MSIQLGFVEESLPDFEHCFVRAARCKRCMEATMGVHPRRVDAITCEWCGDAEHMMSCDEIRFPISVAVGDRLADGETLDVAPCPGEISEVLGRQGRHSET